MMKRRAFLGGTLGAVTLGTCKAQAATATARRNCNSSPQDHLWSLATFIVRTGAVATTARRETFVFTSLRFPSRTYRPVAF
jgi:hypothetical protein